MKKVIAYLFFTGLLFFFTTCKKIKVQETTNKFGTVFGAGGDLYFNVKETSDKNYIIYGTTSANTYGQTDGFVLKVDKNYNIIWYNHFGGVRGDEFSGLALDDEGNMLAAGTSASFGSPTDSTLSESNNLIYLVYISKNGQMLWDTTYHPNPGIKNNTSSVLNVLFLPNKTFCVSGVTFNYITNFGSFTSTTPDAFVLGIDKHKKNLWWGRYYKTVFSSFIEAFEWDGSSVVADDGNIILRTVNATPGNPNDYFINLIKIPYTGPLLPENDYSWISDEIHSNGNLGPYSISNVEKLQGGGVVLYDYYLKGLDFTDNMGKVIKQVLFKNKTVINNIINSGTKLILTTGSDPRIFNPDKTPINNPGWMVVDLNGKVEEEIYVKETEGLENINFKKVFFDDDNEVLAFGSMKIPGGNNIVMFRFDHQGHLIK